MGLPDGQNGKKKSFKVGLAV